MAEKFPTNLGAKGKEKDENEAPKEPSMLQRLVGKAKAAARSLTEETRALVPLEVEPPGYESPRDSPEFRDPVTPPGNDPTQLLAPSFARSAEGFQSALHNKDCEHASRGESSEGFGISDFEVPLGPLLPRVRSELFTVSPEILALFRQSANLENELTELGDSHS